MLFKGEHFAPLNFLLIIVIYDIISLNTGGAGLEKILFGFDKHIYIYLR